MSGVRVILIVAVAVATVSGALACNERPEAEPHRAATTTAPQEIGTRVGVWRQPEGLIQTPIWPGVAPDMAGMTQPPESVLTRHTPDAIDGTTSQAVLDVSVPTMTVFPPKGRNTGAAIVVFPGGGFRAVVLTIEGTEICGWITSKGITCILSKYRVPGSNHYWNPECRCSITPDVPRALQDAQRTIRLVRARAAELQVDPDKIGVMGFSAGGYLVAQTSNIFEPAYTPVDAADRIAAARTSPSPSSPATSAVAAARWIRASASPDGPRRPSCCRPGTTRWTTSATAPSTPGRSTPPRCRRRCICSPGAGTPSA
jgi:hypothetical protein